MTINKLSRLSQPEAHQPTTDTGTPRPATGTASSSHVPPQLSGLTSLRRSGAQQAQAEGSHAASARFRSSQTIRPSAANRDPGTLTNDTNETQFFPLVSEIRSQDEQYLYVTHGTLLDNVPSITEHGLDPQHGGGRRGAASYEGMSSSDARGNLKYAHDPNISLRYSNGPANDQAKKVGVQLEARVKHGDFLSRFTDSRTAGGDGETFWRTESGGENVPAQLNDERYRQSMASAMPTDKDGKQVWSSETNQHIRPEDVRVIGVSVPAGGSVDVSKLKTHYGTDSDAD